MRSIRLRTLLMGLVIAVFALFSLTGSSLAIGPVVDLSKGDDNLRFMGVGKNAYTGELTNTADYNGDGIHDLLVGAAGFTRGSRTFSGAAYVVFGRFGLPSYMEANNANIIVYGKTSFAALGHSVASGDVNGDGHSDIIIAADGQSVGKGEVYVILGGPGRFTTQTIIDLVAHPTNGLALTLVGANDGDRFGRSVTSADVNGDGKDDIIVGAYLVPRLNNVDEKEAGAVYIFYGSDSFSTGHTSKNANQADVKIYGAAGIPAALAVQHSLETARNPLFIDEITAIESPIGDRLGRSVATANLNGDTFADLILGAYGADVGAQVDAGKVYIINGSNTLPAVIDLKTYTPQLTLNGIDGRNESQEFVGDQAGFFVASGNINGDQYDDILVGAYLSQGAANDKLETGEVYIIYGKSFSNQTISLSTANAIIYGEKAGDRLGRSIAAANVVGNEIEDLILGASRADPDGRTDAGIAYVVAGGNLSGNILLSQPSNVAVRVLGAASGATLCEDNASGTKDSDCSDEAGRSVAAGDLDGDGVTDLIIGAVFVNNGANEDAGAVYVMWGTPKPNVYLPLINVNRLAP